MVDGIYVLGGGVIVSAQVLLMVITAALLSLLFFLFFERSMSGRALRATAVNRIGARLVGIRPARTGTIAYFIASLLAGVSAILVGPTTTIYYDSGFMIGLKAFIGAIIGGFTSYPVAALGAVLVGIMESFASFWSSSFKEVIVFGLLIPVLLWQSWKTSGHADEAGEELEMPQAIALSAPLRYRPDRRHHHCLLIAPAAARQLRHHAAQLYRHLRAGRPWPRAADRNWRHDLVRASRLCRHRRLCHRLDDGDARPVAMDRTVAGATS